MAAILNLEMTDKTYIEIIISFDSLTLKTWIQPPNSCLYLSSELRYGLIQFMVAQMAAILNLNMTDMTYIDIINLIRFTGPENIGISIKLVSLSLFWAEI